MIVTSLGQRIIVRFRKPIWMPTAPSKLFRMSVLERKFYDADEVEQIRKLNSVYNAQMESIGKFMLREFYEPASKAGGIPAEFLEVERKEDELIFKENDEINAAIAKQKEEFFNKRIRDLEDKVMEEKFSREELVIQASQQVDDYIKKHKDNPESCLTPENFETVISKAMENPTSYEFCIDKSGRIYSAEEQKSEKRG